MRLLYRMLLFSLTLLATIPMLGCGLAQADTLSDVKDVAKTVDDAASVLCELFAADHAQELAIGSPSDWCAVHDNVKPYIDQVLATQRMGAQLPSSSPSAACAPTEPDESAAVEAPPAPPTPAPLE